MPCANNVICFSLLFVSSNTIALSSSLDTTFISSPSTSVVSVNSSAICITSSSVSVTPLSISSFTAVSCSCVRSFSISFTCFSSSSVYLPSFFSLSIAFFLLVSHALLNSPLTPNAMPINAVDNTKCCTSFNVANCSPSVFLKSSKFSLSLYTCQMVCMVSSPVSPAPLPNNLSIGFKIFGNFTPNTPTNLDITFSPKTPDEPLTKSASPPKTPLYTCPLTSYFTPSSTALFRNLPILDFCV
ncbi:MAG: hypothetical protein BWY34_00451 [Parcubacteria group bacterium ADurb.Bin247]|nr:MAG: hypothetical protein BWY34_00451 [Parcubacteria group bacterium ADurb.Bin247]